MIPFVDKLVTNFQNTFHPGKNIAIDEAMVAWRGPLSFRVYNPDKPDKFGIKVFELCDSATAYRCNLEFYTGRREVSSHGATFNVVDRLISPYMGYVIETSKNNPVTKEPIVKFEAVHQYNQLMGAVDKCDQMVSYNAFKPRRLKW